MKIIKIEETNNFVIRREVYALSRAEATRLVIELVNQLGDSKFTNNMPGSSSYLVHNEKHLPIASFMFLVEEDEKK